MLEAFGRVFSFSPYKQIFDRVDSSNIYLYRGVLEESIMDRSNGGSYLRTE
jgi:hypothetical protein